MTEGSSYQMGPYQIIESSEGTLRWETHAGLAGLKGGRCLVEGTILILGPPEIEKAGFFKTEFLEHLKKLPQWEKTAYFCHSHAVFRCKTGARVHFPGKDRGHKSEPLELAKFTTEGKRLPNRERRFIRQMLG